MRNCRHKSNQRLPKLKSASDLFQGIFNGFEIRIEKENLENDKIFI